ncbi:MAG: hypothetical protein IH850_10735 [Acidobacteria bacterium]|nr:hypothetical protein [Acidobacteriota bacterium]
MSARIRRDEPWWLLKYAERVLEVGTVVWLTVPGHANGFSDVVPVMGPFHEDLLACVFCALPDLETPQLLEAGSRTLGPQEIGLVRTVALFPHA